MNGGWKPRGLGVLVLGVWLGLLSGCGAGDSGSATPLSDPDNPRLIFVSNSNSDWWTAVEQGMLDGGEEFGAQVELRRNNGETQGQVDKLRDILSLPDVMGVAVSAIEADAPGVIDAMRELERAGKVVIAIDSDVAPEYAETRRAYIGTNNVEAGRAAGRAARALRPDGGLTDVFVGTASAANARERKQGFFEGAGESFAEAQVWEDGGDHAKARANVQNALSKSQDVDVLLGLWSYNAPAIAQEVDSAAEIRERVTVVTFDLDEAARQYIEDGVIDASVCQNPYEMGRLGVQLLKAIINDDQETISEILPDGETRDTGVRIVVPTADSPVRSLEEEGDEVLTIEEMNAWLESKGLRST